VNFRSVIVGVLLNATLVAPAVATDAQTFIVTSTADSGPGSLRQAIDAANAAPYPDSGTNAIDFAIPGSGVRVIRPLSPLPAITQPVMIDGYTQPGSSVNTRQDGATNAVPAIEIDGSLAGDDASGLVFASGTGGSFVSGLVIDRFDGAGIFVDHGAVDTWGCFIGTDATGKVAQGNGTGVLVVDGMVVVGEDYDPPHALTVNVISGNLAAGVIVTSEDPVGPTDPAGGVIRNNVIGADATGTLALGNGGDGVTYSVSGPFLSHAANIEDNTIVANGGNGITNLTPGSVIRNNLIGVGIGDLGANGPPLGNQGHGVYVGGDALAVTVADQKFTSGFAAGHASIANNAGAGLYIDGGARVDIIAQGFFNNGGLGIDIAPPGPNDADPGDADTGPNESLNAPVLDALDFDAASGFGDLAGHLDSNPGLDVELHYYLGDACDASGHGEGAQELLDDPQSSGTQETDAEGHTEFTLHSPRLEPGTAVSVLARRFAEDASPASLIVSEFSNCVVVPAGGDRIFADGFDP
jgi:hypothetical protein